MKSMCQVLTVISAEGWIKGRIEGINAVCGEWQREVRETKTQVHNVILKNGEDER